MSISVTMFACEAYKILLQILHIDFSGLLVSNIHGWSHCVYTQTQKLNQNSWGTCVGLPVLYVLALQQYSGFYLWSLQCILKHSIWRLMWQCCDMEGCFPHLGRPLILLCAFYLVEWKIVRPQPTCSQFHEKQLYLCMVVHLQLTLLWYKPYCSQDKNLNITVLKSLYQSKVKCIALQPGKCLATLCGTVNRTKSFLQLMSACRKNIFTASWHDL